MATEDNKLRGNDTVGLGTSKDRNDMPKELADVEIGDNLKNHGWLGGQDLDRILPVK